MQPLKKTFAIILMGLAIQYAQAQASTDAAPVTSSASRQQTTVSTTTPATTTSAQTTSTVTTATSSNTKPVVADCNCCCQDKMRFEKWLLIFSPLLLLLLAFYYFLKKMKQDKFSLASALSSGQQEERTRTETTEDGKQKTITYKENVGSASRTIAFFTGITAIIIAICLVTLQGYNIVACCNKEADFENLWKILGALGIGVIPYGINVWNKNSKEQ